MIDRTIAPESVDFASFEIKQATPDFLDNGLPVYFLQSGLQNILRLELVFNAGSWFESSKGLSYLSSKMMVEGSKTRTAKEIAECIATYGAFMEIHSGFEHVNYTFYLMEKHLSNLLPIISDCIYKAIFPEEELLNLKNITTQSLKVNKEKNQFLASAEFRKILFSEKHPYGRQYWEDDIDNISKNKIVDFVKEYFTLDKLEIFVSGQFNLDSTKKQLNSYFGKTSFDQNQIVNIKVGSPTIEKRESIIHKSESVQSSIRLGCHSIQKNNSDYIPLSISNEILGGYFGSRLMRNIREEKGFTYGIHSSLHTLKNGAYFVIATDVKAENTRQTFNEINKEILLLQSELVSDQELETVKSYILGRFMNSINSPFSLMDKFKTLHYSGLNYQFYNDYVQSVNEVSPEKIKNTAVKYFDSATLLKVVVGQLDN
jgi:zinc protease